MRNKITFYVNQKLCEVGDEKCFMPLADFLRYEMSLTGTKIVCAEGDCGACTVLQGSPHEASKGLWSFKSVNSCILPVFACDGSQIVTVEGLKTETELHPVQKSMCDKFASQCGYCTPGFVCAMTALLEDSILQKKKITEKRAKNYMTGNLCRCTGYESIVQAAVALEPSKSQSLQERFRDLKKQSALKKLSAESLQIIGDGTRLFLPTRLSEALSLKKKYPDMRIVAGATDLGVAVNKGRMGYVNVMSLQNIPELWAIRKTKSHIEIPSRVTLTQLLKYFEKNNGDEEMIRMLNIFASPQIKNSGTLVGNLVNASPIADTIPFLLVSEAEIEVQRVGGKRLIPIDEFFIGYKKLNLKPNEIVTAVRLPLNAPHGVKRFSKLYKVSLRKDLDISAVTLAASFDIKDRVIEQARLAFGGVGPIVLRLKDVEAGWSGQKLNKKIFEDLASRIGELVTPLSDVRGSKDFRLLLCRNLLLKMADELAPSKKKNELELT